MTEIDGSGTEQDPYLITTVEQLQVVNQDLSAHYKLANDIDDFKSKPEEFKPIGDRRYPFTGTFDGNNYVIRNLCIEQPEKDNIGMFGFIGVSGRVVNLGLADATIEGRYTVGGLVGDNKGIVESSYAIEVDVSGHTGVGGLVGWNNCGTINLSYAAKVDVSGDLMVGGLVGSNHNGGKIESSYLVESDISGDEIVGGLVGRTYTEPLDSSFILYSADKTNILEDADLILLRENHRILYVVETKTLYIQIEDEIYTGGDVSPVEVQSLLEGAEVVEMTEEFMSSVVMATHKDK